MDSNEDSITRPLTAARLESFDGTENFDLQRNSPSPHSMLAPMLNDKSEHHYANPEELKTHIEIELGKIDRNNDARKKNNLLYDSNKIVGPPSVLPPRNKDRPENRKNKRKMYKYLLIITVLLALIAVIFSVLSIFGILKVHNNNTKEKETSPETEKLSGTNTETQPYPQTISEEKVNQLQYNLTQLTKFEIPRLQKTIEQLQAKLNKIPQEGKQGPPGPVGPKGAGDFGKCKYKTYTKKNRMNEEQPERTVLVSTYVTESEDKFIFGITCSTKGAAEYSMFHRRSTDGKRQFACKCAGKSKTSAFESTDNYIYCNIHFWECPMSS